ERAAAGELGGDRREPTEVADRMDRPHLPVTGSLRRLAGLLGLAGLPVVVLGVFFVLPVSAMISLGLWPHGRFDLEPAWAALQRERTLRVLWFTVWAAGAATM